MRPELIWLSTPSGHGWNWVKDVFHRGHNLADNVMVIPLRRFAPMSGDMRTMLDDIERAEDRYGSEAPRAIQFKTTIIGIDWPSVESAQA